ncbi:doublesex cognate 73A [Dermatophagoides pteronyssinus]|uniref:doublesex cognate 73A n=1 Tax=Dermatophagoides pteronyssinus TaxID=6956 RepID=UPI003F67B413
MKNRIRICSNKKNIWTILSIISIIAIDNVAGKTFFSNGLIKRNDIHALGSSSGMSRRMKTFLTTLFDRAIEMNNQQQQHQEQQINRYGKWNEFIEEQNLKQQQQHSSLSSTTAIRGQTSIPLTTLTVIPLSSSSTSINQSVIDETNDPNSPYYISMISSNISGSFNRSNIQKNSSTLQSSSSSSSSSSHSNGFITKLFNYAFSTTAPSRIMLTTKRPLITFINVTNLDEMDYEKQESSSSPYISSKMNQLSETYQLSLLNSADPHSSMLQQQQQQQQQQQSKKRLPECATQQVCSAHYVKSNHTQRLCDCSRDSNFNCDEQLNELNEDHIIDLSRKQEFKTKRNSLEAYTQVKLCENLHNLKPCKTPTDWTIMALQSERTGKAHFVVVCKCPDSASFEGPFTHKHPPYARFPGIRVYGMLCNQGIRKSKHNPKVALEIDLEKGGNEFPEFPWELAYAVINSTATQGFW